MARSNVVFQILSSLLFSLQTMIQFGRDHRFAPTSWLQLNCVQPQCEQSTVFCVNYHSMEFFRELGSTWDDVRPIHEIVERYFSTIHCILFVKENWTDVSMDPQNGWEKCFSNVWSGISDPISCYIFLRFAKKCAIDK